MSMVHPGRNRQSADRSDVSEVRASDRDQCGDGGENHGRRYNIPERVGQTALNATERARTRTERLSLIWLWDKSLVLWSGYKTESPVLLRSGSSKSKDRQLSQECG